MTTQEKADLRELFGLVRPMQTDIAKLVERTEHPCGQHESLVLAIAGLHAGQDRSETTVDMNARHVVEGEARVEAHNAQTSQRQWGFVEKIFVGVLLLLVPYGINKWSATVMNNAAISARASTSISEKALTAPEVQTIIDKSLAKALNGRP